jgi:hypothetical protein
MKRLLSLVIVLTFLPSVLGAEWCYLCYEGEPDECYCADLSGLPDASLVCEYLYTTYFDYGQYDAEGEMCPLEVIPEYSTITAMLALLGAALFYFLRK